MDKAVLIGNTDELRDVSGYDRMYFGVEFCDIKIPAPAAVGEALAFAEERGMGFTLVTPYVSDRGLAAAKKAIGALPREQNLEVVVNDYGVLAYVAEERPDLVPVLGRLLARQKRGLGISAFQSDAGLRLTTHWQASGADSKIVRVYLEGMGVRRVELDNLPQGMSSDFSKSGLTASLYHPYGYVTTTRYCPFAYNGRDWPNLKGSCGRPCLRGMIEEAGDAFTVKIYISGNAQFYESSELTAESELEEKGIDRVVYELKVPV